MNIIDLINTPQKDLLLSDQQIQQLTLEEVHQRHLMLQETLSGVLDYDIVISDTNVWLELNAASHSDNRGNTRLMFERQLDFMSKMMRHRGGKFIIMGETYEEIDRFAAVQDPVNHKEADFSDNLVYLNAAARLAKRLILSMQRENRLRIEGISSESHHAAFADPAIVRRVVELFTEGKKVLLLTNDASVAIRSIALCDDLQRINAISDEEWNATYALLRPMAFTFDDLRLLDNYTRQYHYIQMADGTPWMTEVQPYSLSEPRCSQALAKLTIDEYAFRQGDKHRGDNLFIKAEEQPERKQEKKQQQQQAQQKKQQAQSQQKKQQQSKSQEKQQSQSQQQRKQQGKPQQQGSQQQGQQEKQQQGSQQQGQQEKQQQGSQQQGQHEKQQSSQLQGTSDASKATVPDGSPSGLTPEHPASASQQDADAAATTKKPQRRTSTRRTSKKTAETSADEAAQQQLESQPQQASQQDADAVATKKPQRRTSTRKTAKKTADDASKSSEGSTATAQPSDDTTKSDAATKEAAATKGATTKSATATRTKAKSSATEKKTKSSGIKKTTRKKPTEKK